MTFVPASAGTQADMLDRLHAALPLRWFNDTSGMLDALLAGPAANWAWLHQMLDSARMQARTATATGVYLDIIAADCFGDRIIRGASETDVSLRTRILAELLRPRATRRALSDEIARVSGNAPVIFEPARPADTGAWNHVNGYGIAGGWGSLALPNQCLVRSTGGADAVHAAAAATMPSCGVAWTRIE